MHFSSVSMSIIQAGIVMGSEISVVKRRLVAVILFLLILVALIGGYVIRKTYLSVYDPDATKVVTEYVQAVATKNKGRADTLGPGFARVTLQTTTETVFHTEEIGHLEIGRIHVLAAKEYAEAVASFSDIFAPPTEPNMFTIRQKAMKEYPADDVAFYRIEITETSGQRRKLQAYVGSTL